MNVDLGDLVEDIVDEIIGDDALVFHRQIIFLDDEQVGLLQIERSGSVMLP